MWPPGRICSSSAGCAAASKAASQAAWLAQPENSGYFRDPSHVQRGHDVINGSTAVAGYETFCQIRDHLGRQRLTVAQTARSACTRAR